jgi:hypothetical protein
MRLTALAPIAAPGLGVPAVLYGGLPSWCLLALVGVSVLLTATQVIVTQIIRLRASGKITRSQDALRVLEIEDLRGARPGRTGLPGVRGRPGLGGGSRGEREGDRR